MDDPRPKDSITELFGEFSERLRGDRWRPAVDVFETEEAIVVRLELAGLRSSDLRVTVEGNRLRIRGVRTPPAQTGGGTVQRLHQMEIAFGPFEREIRVSIPFDSERVTANLEEGFLRVTLPKQIAKPKRIDISRESA